jgi:hypothetical protein
VLTWTDARNGLNHEQALVQTSTNQGLSWSTPVNAAAVASDRSDNPAVAISPTGSDLYLVYDAFLRPFQTTTANPPRMQGGRRPGRRRSGQLGRQPLDLLGQQHLPQGQAGLRVGLAQHRSPPGPGSYNGVIQLQSGTRSPGVCPAHGLLQPRLAQGK